ncbi:ATP-binding cassette domain-containing protein [Microbacterium sp. X-17]|uniref:ATP-binding cassette domain-containing protein n=1 Tax=Microbacterium sp. X-17 TaxID=3144404 RepID=UPI0031F57743
MLETTDDSPDQPGGGTLLAPRLTIRELRKVFGGVTVLHDVSLTIEPGTFVGLLGPNGAGKSTMIKVLDGIYAADGGAIEVGGKRVGSLAGRADVGFVHQDLGLINDLSVVDNLRLGLRLLGWFGVIIDRSKERRAAEKALARVGLEHVIDKQVGALSPGEKTLVAVAKALQRGARILVMDESTSTLPPRDAERLITQLRRIVEAGGIVIMVTHKLQEVFGAADRFVVLVDGSVAVDTDRSGLESGEIVRALNGTPMDLAPDEQGAARPDSGGPGRVIVELQAAQARLAGPIDLTIRAGDILGVTGIPGSGLHDFALMVHGSLAPERGRVISASGTRRALVPPDRESQGGFEMLTIRENLSISALRKWTSFGFWLRNDRELDAVRAAVDALDVRPPSPLRAFGGISGGNKQKVIFGRALEQGAHLYVLCEPTRGVDVQTRAEIYRLIRRLANSDVAVVVVSSDVEDIRAVCDRVAVVEAGTLSPLRTAADMTTQEWSVFV